MRWILLAFAVLFQLTLTDLMTIGKATPDFFLIAIFVLLASLPASKAALIGFLAGVALDLGGVDPFGASALAGTSAAFFASRHLDLHRKLPLVRLLPQAAAIFIPIEIFLCNLRYTTMGSTWIDITFGRALPSSLYSLLLLVLIWSLQSHGKR